jgi:hypothetical protein
VQDPADDHDALELDPKDATVELNSTVNLTVSLEAKHSHKIAAGAKTDKAPGLAAHTHVFTKKDAAFFGAAPPARPGPAHEYVSNLQIRYDGQDITAQVLQQLAGRDPANWGSQTLGNGLQGHVFVQTGTGAIELHRLVSDVGPGQHVLEFRVPAGGGKIYYNLYVE